MAKYRLKLNLTDGSIVTTTNAIEIPAITSAVFSPAPVDSVTFTINESGRSEKVSLTIYDGQDTSGDIVYQSTGTGAAQSPITLDFTSGHFFVLYITNSLVG